MRPNWPELASLAQKTGMDDFQVREATTEDKDEVLGIHDNVYEGTDYLPLYYDQFLVSSDITPFILLHRHKIIGYSAAHIVDDGKTLVTRAVRIRPEYAGKGLYGYFDKCMTEWAVSKGVSTKAFTSSDQNTNISKTSFQETNTLILHKRILVYFAEMDKLLLDTTSGSLEQDIKEVEDDILTTYLTTAAINQYLFPCDRVIVDYVPYKLLESNVPHMRGPNDVTTIFSDVRMDNNCYGLLTCGTSYPVQNPSFHLKLEVYGTDESSLKNHIAAHLNTVKQRTNDVTSIAVYVEKQISTEHVDSIFAEYGITRFIWRDPKTSEPGYTDSYLFEKKLQ